VEADGIALERVIAAGERLNVQIPRALSEFYTTLGAVNDLCAVHNWLKSPEELTIFEDHLYFMDENQSVVSWGFPLSALDQDDPVAWQRNNTEGKWYSEELSFSAFMKSMFDWYLEIGMWESEEEEEDE